MKRYLWAAIAALALLPPPVACQTGSGTIIVVDRSRLQVQVIPQTFTGEVGDTMTMQAIAVDTISGDTIPSVIRWRSQDSTAVAIDPTTGLATLLRAGTWQVFATVTRIIGVAMFRAPNQFLEPSYSEEISEELTGPESLMYAGNQLISAATVERSSGYFGTLCAYLLDPEGLLARSSDRCPSWQPSMLPIQPSGVVWIDPQLGALVG